MKTKTQKTKEINLGYIAMCRYTPRTVLSPDYDDKKVDPKEIVLKQNDYTLVIEYPLTNPYKEQILVGKKGMTRRELVNIIVAAYKKVYASGDTYGIWGHYIGDLMLASAEVDCKNIITLGVDS